jgi:RNA polymerase sigma factor (sigma-70 family)
LPWAATVQQIRSGDELSMETLCAAVTECARAQLYQSVEPQAVDDHVQEVLIIVLAAVRREELRNPDCLMGFVRTVTRRQVTVHIRRNIVRRRRILSVESGAVPTAPADESPEARLRLQERVALVRNVLGQLCPRDREILVRFYYDEQESQQICLEMRLTSTQFRLYKSRALAKCSELRRVQSTRQSTRPLRIA